MADHAQREDDVLFIALGSNIEPESNLPRAVQILREDFALIRSSSVWESAPVGFLDQPAFLNAAVMVQASASIQETRSRLRTIEDQLGRVRDPLNKNVPRTIDLDIALFENEVISSEFCNIPDPDIMTRPFLAVPLAELDFERIHPTQGLSLGEIARRIGGIRELTLREDVRLPCCKDIDIRELRDQFN